MKFLSNRTSACSLLIVFSVLDGNGEFSILICSCCECESCISMTSGLFDDVLDTCVVAA